MSVGMAEVIAAHSMYALDDDGMMVCWFNDCGWRHARGGDPFALRAAHVAEELAKAGFGKLDPLAAALADPEGRALVKAIHDRKANDRGR